MQIVIEIPEEDYSRIKEIPDAFESLMSRAYKAIKNGTPLPKSHGRLIDADEAIELVADEFDGVCVYDVSTSKAINDFESIVDHATTVIPADRENEDASSD